MDIFYTLNDAYVPHLAASVCSLCENNAEEREIVFHVVSMGIREENKEKMRALVQRYRRTLHFYELESVAGQFDFDVDTGGFDVSVLARLLVGRLLPEGIDRVLYLDCDTIVLWPLRELWELDLTGYVLGAVSEPTMSTARKESLGMRAEDLYYNCGVLLINLAQWRSQNAERRVVDYYAAHGGNLPANDQDAINGALGGEILELSPRYNFGSIQIYYPYRTLVKICAPAPYLARERHEEALRSPAIIHYLGEERPWRAGSTHPYTKDYERYLSLTPWKDTPKEAGWDAYFFFFRIFNAATKPVPIVRYRVINALIPAFMRHRAKQRKRR
jgi:lipopolysaccharide biosynthesis glycosyltransferase